MSRARQSRTRKRLKKAVPALGAAAGISLSLASGASAGPAPNLPMSYAGSGHEVILAEEEISDVSLATFYFFDNESTTTFRPDIQLARGGCGGCGGGGCRGCGGCGGCGGRGGCGGCGGCRCGGCGGCGGFWIYGGCGGCVVCAGCAVGWGVPPPPPAYFYPPAPTGPPITRLRPPHKDESPVETSPVHSEPPAAPATSPAAGPPGPVQD